MNETMPSYDGRQGAMTMSGKPFDDEFKERAITEALKGARFIREIAEEHGITRQLLTTWLHAHYADNPLDPRHHKIERESPNFSREDAGQQVVDDDDEDEGEPEAKTETEESSEGLEADDDMTKKKKRPVNTPAATIAAYVAQVRKGEKSQKQVADEAGVTQSAVGLWMKKARATEIEAGDPRQAVVFEAWRKGMTDTQAMKAAGLTSKSTIYRWKKVFKLVERRRIRAEALAKARDKQAEMLKDPNYREEMRQRHWRNARPEQSQLTLPEQTMTSQPGAQQYPAPQSYAPPSAPISVARVSSPAADFIDGAFKECVEERLTLRGMVKILERESEQQKRKLDAYRARYGEIPS